MIFTLFFLHFSQSKLLSNLAENSFFSPKSFSFYLLTSPYLLLRRFQMDLAGRQMRRQATDIIEKAKIILCKVVTSIFACQKERNRQTTLQGSDHALRMNYGQRMNLFSVIDQPMVPQSASACPAFISKVQLYVQAVLVSFSGKMIFFLQVFRIVASYILQLLISTVTSWSFTLSLNQNLPPDSSSLNSSCGRTISCVQLARINLLQVSSLNVYSLTIGQKTSYFLPDSLMAWQSILLCLEMIY